MTWKDFEPTNEAEADQLPQSVLFFCNLQPLL